MTGVAVTNSTCLIALERIGRLDVLQSSFEHILVPSEVQQEFGTVYPWLEIRTVANTSLVTALRLHLASGEASAIALAVEVAPTALILDDRKARLTALRMDLPILGTVGLMIRAKRLGIIPRVRPLLDELSAKGFRMSQSLYVRALDRAGEKDEA